MSTDALIALIGGPLLSAVVAWQVARVRINGLADESKRHRDKLHDHGNKLTVLWYQHERRK